MTEFSNNVESAAKVAADIDNGASEASTNVSKNAQTSTEQVNNLQSCAKGHSTDYGDFSDQKAQAVVEENSAIKQRMKSKKRRAVPVHGFMCLVPISKISRAISSES